MATLAGRADDNGEWLCVPGSGPDLRVTSHIFRMKTRGKVANGQLCRAS
jgi:hypothetical protein